MATTNPEDESLQEVMEDVSTILKNEIQSICTRLANIGEESLFVSAKVADKETTKLGSDTGFIFMSKFNISQQFYNFVEDVYSSKSVVPNYKAVEEGSIEIQPQSKVTETGDKSQTNQHKSEETTVHYTENRTANNYVVSHTNQYQDSGGTSNGEKQGIVHPTSSADNVQNVVLRQDSVSVYSNGQTTSQTVQENASTTLANTQFGEMDIKTAAQTTQVANAQIAQKQPDLVLQGNSQCNNQLLSVTHRDPVISDKNSRTQVTQNFSENANNEPQIPLQFVPNAPCYLPVGIGNPGLPGVFVDQANLVANQGFIPQYGISSNLPPSVINAPIVSSTEMEKIDPTGIVSQALVQSGIHENVVQAPIESGHQVIGNIDNATAKLAIPEGLDILQSDDTNKYHFFLEALRFLNPELYPRAEFAELSNQRNEGISIPYVEADALQYTDAQHMSLQPQNIQQSFSDIPMSSQHLLNSVGQTVMVDNPTDLRQGISGANKIDGNVPTEKKKKRRKKKKKEGNILDRAVNVLKDTENNSQGKSPETSPSKRQSKGKEYKCDICNQYVDSHRDIALHKVMHGGKIPPKCTICNNRFTTKRGLKHHMLKHQKPPNSYACETCEKVFSDKSEYTKHRQEHGNLGTQSSVTVGTEQISQPEYQTAVRYEEQSYHSDITPNVAHFQQADQLVSPTANVPVGNIMCTVNTQDNVSAQETSLNHSHELGPHIVQGNHQISNFSAQNNLEMVPHESEQNQQISYSEVRHDQPVNYSDVGHNQPLNYSNVGHNQPVNYSNVGHNQQFNSNDEQQNNLSQSTNNLNGKVSAILEEDAKCELNSEIMSTARMTVDMSKMVNASDIVLDGADGMKGTCKICGEEISSFEQTIVHFTIHKEQQSINESKKKREKAKDKSKKQPTRHRKGRKYSCETCGQQFLHFNGLCLHRISHKGKSPEKCQICYKGFTSKRGVRLHMELHKKNIKPYTCNFCKVEIIDVEEYIEHKKTHGEQQEDSSSVVGSVCFSESDISSSNSLQLHQSSEKTNNQNLIQQEIGGLEQTTSEKTEFQNTLNDIQTMIHHTISHQIPGSYPPNYDSGLNTQQIHNVQQSNTYTNPLPNMQLNIDPLQIAQMNLFFQQLNEQVVSNAPTSQQHDNPIDAQHHSKEINDHIDPNANQIDMQNIDQNSGEKKGKKKRISKKKNGKYTCDECEKHFPMFHELRLHKITHKGQSPQVCTVCNKLFVSKKGLRDHMSLHKKHLQKNVCDICEKEFTDLNQLILHKLEHVEEARTQISDNRDKEVLPIEANYVENDQSPVVIDLENPDTKDNDETSGKIVEDRVNEIEGKEPNEEQPKQSSDSHHVNESNSQGTKINESQEIKGSCEQSEEYKASQQLNGSNEKSEECMGSQQLNENGNDCKGTQQLNESNEKGEEYKRSEQLIERRGQTEESQKLNERDGKKNVGDVIEKDKCKDSKLTSELTCLIDHVSNDSSNDEHECPFCRERFSGPESLKQHLYIHMEDSDTPGEEQNDDSIIKPEDSSETFNNSDESVHVCNVCGERFSGIEAFDFHSKKHKPAKVYKCKVCCEKFTDINCFKNHKKVSGHGTKRIKCEICSKLFNKEENLKKHKIKVHKTQSNEKQKIIKHKDTDVASDVLTCAICGKVFRSKNKFRDHVNYHRGTTPHRCQICNKIFTRASGLKDHMNLHSGRKPYRCDICGKRYADISNWRKHRTSHSNPIKTPFKCSICKEKFTLWKQIKNHTALLHPDSLTFLRISNKPKLKRPKQLTSKC